MTREETKKKYPNLISLKVWKKVLEKEETNLLKRKVNNKQYRTFYPVTKEKIPVLSKDLADIQTVYDQFNVIIKLKANRIFVYYNKEDAQKIIIHQTLS